MISTHLTIDLDYWMHHADFRGMRKFLKKVKSLPGIKQPIKIVKYHNFVLPIIGSGINTIINVDYHSDIADLPHRYLGAKDFGEGSWVNYATMKKREQYIWCYPRTECPSDEHGFCHADHNPFDSEDPMTDFGWKRLSMRKGLPTEEMLSTVRSVSICVSPNWLGRRTPDAILVLRSLGLVGLEDIRLLHEKDSGTKISIADGKLFNQIAHLVEDIAQKK